MMPCGDALHVDEDSTAGQLDLAAQRLARCEGVVVLAGTLALRATATALTCEVIDPAAGSHRCAEEFKVMIEDAGRRLAASRLAERLPRKALHWVVVDRRQSGTATLYSARQDASYR